MFRRRTISSWVQNRGRNWDLTALSRKPHTHMEKWTKWKDQRMHKCGTISKMTATKVSKIAVWVIVCEVKAHSFIHSGYFYSASTSLLLLRGAPDTSRIRCGSFTPKRHKQLRVKDLPKVLTWWLERDLNPRPFGRKAPNLPMSHHAQE